MFLFDENIAATSQSSIYLPLISTLVGGLLTFLGGLTGSYLVQKFQRDADRKNLASAFYGEISALLEITEKRQYIQGVEANLQEIKTTGRTNLMSFAVTLKYFNVYDQNVGKLGVLLAPLPEKIVSFYTLTFAAIEDFQEIASGKYQNSNAAAIEKMLEELLDICNEAVALGKEIQTLIKPN